MGYKLKNGSAAKMMAASPLFETEGVDYGTDSSGRKYYYDQNTKNMIASQNKLKPGDADYANYSRNDDGTIKRNKFGHAILAEGAYSDASTVSLEKTATGGGKSNLVIGTGDGKGKKVDLSGTSGGDVGSSTNQGGNNQNNEKLAVSGPSSNDAGVGSGSGEAQGTGTSITPSGGNTTNTDGDKDNTSKKDDNTKTNTNKNRPKAVNPYTKAKAKDPNLDKYIRDRNAAEKGSADYAFAQNQINKAYGVDKRHQVKLEKMETRGPARIEGPTSKLRTTIDNAMDPTFDNISSRRGNDRYTRMSKRQEKRTQKALGTYQKPESTRQERKNLLTDMPVDKDATGGRYKNDRATKNLVKETSKQAKKDNAMKEAKAAVEAGDKKALRKSGVAGKYKRAGRQDIAAAKKAGAMDVAKAAVEAGDKKALRKSGVEGKYKRAGRQDIRAAKNLAKQKESAKQEASDLLAYSPVADREASTFDYSQSRKQNRKRYK